jgi:DNA mismatch repair protein MutL
MTTGKTIQRWIKPLPERVINKIAAGEVIERPAAVVKELVENSIDADATRIDIIIEKSGAKLIKIVDNGCGIPEDQIEIAFSRHATSKIRSFDDLNVLNSYGFRGEALPSIASVSKLRMISRTADSDTGCEIIYEGGVLQSKNPIAAPIGTSIEIENLFYNTPARRKFLKAESTEARHISRTSMAMALSRPDIGFNFKSNDRTVFSVLSESNLKDRAVEIFGANLKMVELSGETETIKLSGYIGTPDLVRQNRNSQFLFINNRFIQSPTISHALVAGYGEMIPRGKFPIGVLRLEVNADQVDVNVHPTKAEVRLSHEKDIHHAVYQIVKESLRSDGIIPVLKPSGSAIKDYEKLDFIEKEKAKLSSFIPGVAQASKKDISMVNELYKNVHEKTIEENIVQVNKSTGEIVQATDIDESISSGFRLVGRFSDLYLLLQSGDNLYIVDQHTAHERVLYEEMLLKVDNSSVEGQTLLFPVQVELDPEQFVVFDDTLEILNKSGFTVSHFGGRTVNIEAIPSILKNKSPEKLFMKIIDDIASLKKSGFDLKKAIAQSIACRSAVMSGDRLNDTEATHLLKQLLKCDNKYTCPHGRPTFIKLSKDDLDKQFGRSK